MSSRSTIFRLGKVSLRLLIVLCLIGIGVLNGYPAHAQTAPAVTASATGPNTISLSWSAVTGATKYNVYRKDGTTYSLLTGTAGVSGSSYVASGLSPATDYYFAVSTSNNVGEGAKSSDATARTWCLPPANLTAAVGSNTVYLNWQASTGARRYTVHRKQLPNGVWGTIFTGGDSASPSTTYNDINATNGTTFVYRVLAFNGNVFSTQSNEVSGTPGGSFAAPTNLIATGDYAKINLSWAASRDASSYKVYWGVTSGNRPNLLGTVTAPTATITHTGLSNATTYYYAVRAVNASNVESSDSNQAVGTTLTWAGPTNLAIIPGDRQMTLSWNADPNATQYRIYRGTAAGGPYGTLAGTVNATTTTFTNTNLTNGTTYYYVVRSYNGSGESDNSNQVSGVGRPPSPTNVTATAGGTQITVSWIGNTSAAIYRVYDATTHSGPYTLVQTVTAPTTSTTFTVGSGQTHYYVVTAVGSAGVESLYSSEANATTAVVTFKKPDALFAVGDAFSDDVYAPTVQPKDGTASIGTPAIYTFLLQNDGNVTDSLRLQGEVPQGWTVTYYDAFAGGNDITAQVKAGTYTDDLGNLPPGAMVEFRVEVEPQAGVANNITQSVQITVFSTSDSNLKDVITVRTVSQAPPDIKPDALVRLTPAEGVVDESTNFIGDNLYDPADPNQTISTLTVPGQSRTYQLQAQNDGTFEARLTVKLPSVPAGWTVQVFNAPIGGTDITTQVKSAGGWQTQPLQQGGTATLRVIVTPDTTTSTGSTIDLNVLGGNALDTVKITSTLQSVAGIQYSVDQGTTWQGVPVGGLEVNKRSIVGFRAVKSSSALAWPLRPFFKPIWTRAGTTYIGETTWFLFPDVTTGVGENIQVECGNSVSTTVRVVAAPTP